jgi:RNA polymerase sigma-70 factor (ECF subfamily)
VDSRGTPVGSNRTAARNQSSEGFLVEQAVRGDKRAIGELYNRYVDRIYRYVYSRVRSAAAAEDLTAEVFVKALEALPGYTPTDRPLHAWLYSIARARTIDYWRKQDRRQHVELADNLPAKASPPHELLDLEEQWAMAIDLIAQLTDEQQDVLLLRFVGELGLQEVAQVLGKTLGSVKALQHRALASLARLRATRTADRQDERSV